MKTVLLLLAFGVFSVTATAQAPDVPGTKMSHKQEFIDKDTLEKRRIYKTKTLRGAEKWDENRKRYVKHGVFYGLRKDGVLQYITTWNMGKKDGLFEEYTKKGLLKQQGVYALNKKTEEWLWFHNDGRLSSRYQYENGKKNGVCISYLNSKKRIEYPQFITEYKNGKRDGSYKQYNNKKKKVIWGSYSKGKKVGVWYHDIGSKVFEKDWSKKR